MNKIAILKFKLPINKRLNKVIEEEAIIHKYNTSISSKIIPAFWI